MKSETACGYRSRIDPQGWGVLEKGNLRFGSENLDLSFILGTKTEAYEDKEEQMSDFFLLNLNTTDPAYNLAVEEYVFESLPKENSYFMLWQNDNAIIIGKHQNTLAEINETYVKEHDIKVVRRLSGGGAVYHDLGNLNFTFITENTKNDGLDFRVFCEPLVEALSEYNVKAVINGRNDVTIDGKKFSGNAQYVKMGRVMHHGTIMFNSDLDMVSKALRVDPEKIKSKGVASTISRVTNVSAYLCGDFAETKLEDFRKAFLNKIASSIKGREYILSDQDKESIERIKKERYDTWDWNYGRSPECSILRKKYFEGCGLVEAYITIKRGKVENIEFKGDFFSYVEPEELCNLLQGVNHKEDSYRETLADIDIPKYFQGLSKEDFIGFLLG